MHCKHCGFGNGEDDHRCLRCGRRISGVVIAASASYVGANALQVAPAYQPEETQDFQPFEAAQAPLFGNNAQKSHLDHKVIPFDQIQRQVAGRIGQTSLPIPFSAPPAERAVPSPRGAAKRTSSLSAEQGALDFVPAAAIERTLKTAVPAQVYCEQPVATPQHRLVASAVDAALILLGFGVFALGVELTGSSMGTGKVFWMTLAASLVLISLFYGLIWVIAGRETAGMDWTDLQLITFDGFPVDARTRAVRFASTLLSFCSGGLGLVWAIADEENLTWHDHISKTFPTFREAPRNFVRQRRL